MHPSQWGQPHTTQHPSQQTQLHAQSVSKYDAVPILPPGWTTVKDQISGRIYYANITTGETSWTAPVLPPPPPPPPPPLQRNIPPPPLHINTSIPPPGVLTTTSLPIQQPSQHTPFIPQQPAITSLPISTIIQTPTLPIPAPVGPKSQRILDPAVSGGMLVPTIRSIVDSLSTSNEISATSHQPEKIDKSVDPLSKDPYMELPQLSAGTIADLCNITRDYKTEQRKLFKAMNQAVQQLPTEKESIDEDEEEDEELFVEYQEALKPQEMPVAARPPHIEPGRVDIRIMSLYDQLELLRTEHTRANAMSLEGS